MKSFEQGGQTEAVVLSVLSKAGYTVLIPFGVARYDLAIDDGSGKNIRTVQCKTGRLRGGCVVWNAHSSHTLTHVRTSYRGQVDYFGVLCPGYEDVYLVPVELVGSMEGRLRVDQAKIGAAENYRWAKDFIVQGLPTTGV
jgi:hypothetical protein